MDKDKVEVVERPAALKKYPYAEIVATAETGKAVRLTLNGVAAATITVAIVTHLRRHNSGFRLRQHDPKDGTLIVWAERRTLA